MKLSSCIELDSKLCNLSLFCNSRHKINKAGIKEGQSQLPLVLDCSHISTADFTAAKGFKAMITDFRRRSQQIIFFNTSTSVLDVFSGIDIEGILVVHSIDELNEYLRGKLLRLFINYLSFTLALFMWVSH